MLVRVVSCFAASGSASTDDVTINSQVSAASADIFAGDSVSLGSSASVVSSDTEISVGTNYNPVTAATSTGTSNGTFSTVSSYPANAVIDGGAEIRTVYNSTGLRQIDSIFELELVNSNRALFEDLGVWVNSAINAIMPAVSEFDNVIEPDNSGEIEEVDEDGKSSFYFRRNELDPWNNDDLFAEFKQWDNVGIGSDISIGRGF